MMNQPIIMMGFGGGGIMLMEMLRDNARRGVPPSPLLDSRNLLYCDVPDDDNPEDLSMIDDLSPYAGRSYFVPVMTPSLKQRFSGLAEASGLVVADSAGHISVCGNLEPFARNGCVFQSGVSLGGANRIGLHNYFGANTSLGHHVEVGDCCYIGHSVVIASRTTIGNNCYISNGAMVVDNVAIGDNVVVASGSTVFRDVPSNTTVIARTARMVQG